MRKAMLMMLLPVLVAGCNDIVDIANMRIIYQPKSSALVATCDGTRINWNYCYEAASKLCPYGYEVSDKREIPDAEIVANRTRVTRNMYFRCK